MHTEILELEITQEDIDKAIALVDIEPQSCICPVSQSALRNKVENFNASADGRLFDKNHHTLWDGGEDCRKFQNHFDVNDTAKPTKLIFTRKVA